MDSTKPKTVLNIETAPRVELNFMNNTHFEEIIMVEKIGKLVNRYQNIETPLKSQENQLSTSLQEWLDHTVSHFERENELMQKTGFPAYPIHSNEHELALNKMKSVVQAWNNNKDIELIADYIFNSWPDWFMNHVNSMDMITAKFAVMNGYTEN